MVKITLKCVFFLLISFTGYSQKRIKFEYDSAGNQIKRYVCLCAARQSDELLKFEDLKEDDLLKLYNEDVVSYYPNPVEEKLFLKWELIDDKRVSLIELFSISGKKISSINNLEKENSKIVSFESLPTGSYVLNLIYTSGEVNSIKIIKN